MRMDHATGTAGFRFCSSPVETPRARRATNLLAVIAALAGLLRPGWIRLPPTSFDRRH